jgi:hypothetical protein
MGVTMTRRGFGAMGAGLAALWGGGALAAAPALPPVIVDNDFAGDPDGLVQLSHHLLCPSVTIPLVVSSHLPARPGAQHSASEGRAKVAELLDVMHLPASARVMAGAEGAIAARARWTPGPATRAIIETVMNGPVLTVYAAGASLTELALAWLAEPRIGPRLRLVWIGGREHPGLALPPEGGDEPEFNFALDPVAAQVVFNESDITIWQVPRDAYRQMLFSGGELDEMAGQSRLGAWLKAEIDGVAARLAAIPGMPALPRTDAYALGDSPLVTLTALVPPFSPDPASSRHVTMPTPRLMTDGSYRANPRGRPMRAYTGVDAGLTFRDMTARFRALERRTGA